jgi:twinkle protein
MTESSFVQHEPCPSCGSSDALARYDDGHGYCHSCEAYFPGDGSAPVQDTEERRKRGLIDAGGYRALTKRNLSEETCRKWGYSVSRFNGEPVQIATYRDTGGRPVAQKIRTPSKEFLMLGDTKNCGLYGMHLWRDGGKRLVITEGEIDALSVSQVQANKWPVVSVPNGAKGAAKSLKKNLDWVERFETVVFMFDNDEPGRAAAEECALLLTPGKAHIASLPMKDANEMLCVGRVKELIDAMWAAKPYRPDGIVNGSELWDEVLKSDDHGLVLPWDGLQKMVLGLRTSEVITLCAGTGVGKSQVCRELAYHLIQAGETLGYIALEEPVRRTSQDLMALHLGTRLRLGRDGVTDEQLREAFDATVGNGRTYLYDHFGSSDGDHLLAKLRYLVKGFGCKWVILDHISIVVSGSAEGDERRNLDNIMTKLASFAEEADCGLILVSHLKRPEGKAHEEGGKVSLAQLRGTAGIGQLSHIVIGLERDQQDPDAKHMTTLRVLKNRWTGETGAACVLRFDETSGRMHEVTEFDTGGDESPTEF